MEKWTLYWTKLIQLTSENLDDIPENIPGVYRLSYKHPTDGNYYVFYVGKSENIKRRLLEHIAPEEVNEGIKLFVNSKICYFKYAQVSEDYIRSAAERQMYKHYEPTYNRVEPEGREDVEVNLN
jgi:excinuclease UvrABC nuclease subunit